MTEAEIRAHAETIKKAALRDFPIKDTDKPLVEAIFELSVNLLQNINQIARKP